MQVYLIGYMGSGKTTVCKQLARALRFDFFDLDEVIEKAENRSIPEIFAREGESSFRGLERKYLRQLIDTKANMVLSTGGGTPCFYDNHMIMKKAGITVYLKMDVATLVHLLSNAKEERPLVAGKSPDELTTFIKNHLEERSEYYDDCDIIFPALGFNRSKLDLLVGQIAEKAR